ncbi:unnamed protein product, partial [Brenthis ino]
MDEPKAPDDARNWESMDIYLFSNGQQCSPPRKYHLRCEELKLWDATLCFLAHSHYGSMQSNIELYTLDGKKISSPLELKNDTAYVAVKPPDAFISAGDNKYIQDCTKECIIALNVNKDATATDNEVFLNSKTVVQNICPNCETSMMTLKENNNLPENLSHKQNSKEIQKCDIKRINSRCSKANKKDPILFKRKDTSMINKTEVNNHIRQLAPPNNSISHHVIKNRQCKDKTKQKTPKDDKKNSKINSEVEVGKIGNGVVSSSNNEEHKDNMKYKNNNNSPRSDIVSNIFRNLENDTQSLFMDENQNLLELKNKLEDISQSNSNKINETFAVTTNKNENTTNLIEKKNQEQNTDFVDKEGKLNIFLNINLKDYTTPNAQSKTFLNKCNSELRVLSHRPSQVNIDVMLSKGGRNFKNNAVPQIEKPPECDTNNNKSFGTTIDGNKVTVIRCKCDSKHNILTERYTKEHSNFFFLLPIVEEKERSNGDIKFEMVDKEIQVSSDPNSEVGDKTETQEDSSLQNNFDEECKKGKVSECSENEEVRKNAPTIMCKSPSDMFTQTEWCNVLVTKTSHYNVAK